MKIRRRISALISHGVLLASISIATAATASAETEGAVSVRSAVANSEWDKAGRLLNQMVEATLIKGTARPDPELDRLFADILFELGRPHEARPILDRALAATPPGTEANALRLKRAHVLEGLANFAASEKDYRDSVEAFAVGTSEHREAVFGLARVLLSDKPDEASRLASEELANGLADGAWEGHLVIARAAAMLGHADAARGALESAWMAAPRAPIVARAVTRLTNEKALHAGLAGDREALVALSAVGRADRYQLGFTPDAIRSGLPVCGSHGILPADMVVIELVDGVGSGPAQARLAYANRPGIARPFLEGLVNNPAFMIGRIGGPAASLEMRCVTAPPRDYAVLGDMPTLLAEWLISNGAYPVAPESQNDGIAVLSQHLNTREARFGPNSLLLVPVLLQLYTAYMMQGSDLTGTAMKPLVAISERIEKIVTATDAPADVKLMLRLSVLGSRQAAETTTVAVALDEYQRALSDAISNPSVSLDMIYATTTSAAAAQSQGSREFKADLAQSALSAFERRTLPGDRRRQALALRVADLAVQQGDTRTADALRRKAGFAQDLCRFSDPRTSLVHQEISADDFPKDAIKGNIQGLTAIDFGLSASGHAQDARIVLADPPLIFNQVVADEAGMLRYEPPRIGGRPAACRGQVQNVRWQLPY